MSQQKETGKRVSIASISLVTYSIVVTALLIYALTRKPEKVKIIYFKPLAGIVLQPATPLEVLTAQKPNKKAAHR